MDINILLIPALMFLGVALQRVRIGLKPPHIEMLIIYFTGPMLMFTEMLKVQLGEIGSITIVSLIYLGTCFLVGCATSRGLQKQARGTIIFNSTFLNSMFLPFPLIHAFYGDLSAALLFSLPIMIIHNTIGILLASFWGNGKVERKALIHAFTFPPLIAFFIGLLMRPFGTGFISSQMFEVLHGAGKITVYLSLILIGLYLPISKCSLLVFRNRIAGVIVLNRMFISPIIGLVLVTILNPVEIMRNTIIIMSFMPPAITNLIIVSKFNLDVKASSQSIFLPSLLSLVIVFTLRFLGLL